MSDKPLEKSSLRELVDRMPGAVEHMTLEELTARSALLYEIFYRIKSEIQSTNHWRQHRATEADAKRRLEEAQRELAGLDNRADKPPPQIIYPDPIESDEAVGEVNKDGDTVNQWLMKLLSKAKRVDLPK